VLVLRRVLISAAAFSLVAALAFQPSAGRAATTTPGITFGAPSIVDPVRTYGEPDVRTADDGTTYVSGPWGTGTQRSIWNRSTDSGRTFLPMHQVPISSANESDTNHPGPGGGDTEISIDHTGKTYYADLAALTTLKVATWDESTKTMQTSVFGNTDQGLNGVDRQWFALWDPTDPQSVRDATGYTGPFPVNYLQYAEALIGCCQASAYSTDGLTYNGPTEEYTIANDGPTEIDQQTGTVLEAISKNSLSDVGVALLSRSSSQPASDPSITQSQVIKIADLPLDGTTAAPNDRMTTRALFPVMAFDSARNAYVVWVTRAGGSASQDSNAWQIFYSFAHASSGWTNWSAPRKISTPPSNTNIMPWAVAGAGGRLAVVWYGTNDAANNPSTTDVHQAWDVYLATITNAASGSPSIRQMKVTPHPMHYGTICLEGTGCIASQGNRNLADFFQVYYDRTDGAIEIAYDDTSNEFTQRVASGPGIPPPVDGAADHRGAPVVSLIKQNSGIGMFGTAVSGPRAGGSSISDPVGDAHFDPIYGPTPVPQLDLKGLNVHISGANLVFKLPVKSLQNLQAGLTATGSQAIDYVIRWSGGPESSATGTRNPIYYAAVEVQASGSPEFFAGEAQSIELCSVSGCFPHLIEYPKPPYSGQFVNGKKVIIKVNRGQEQWWLITVPRSVVGNPAVGSRLHSFGAYTFARNKNASIPLTNTEAENGILPVEVDGVCCINAALTSPG
jgi:hypothetical protein